jgi:hypothetical protein
VGSPCTSAGQAAHGRAGTPRAPVGKKWREFQKMSYKAVLRIHEILVWIRIR